MAAAKRQWLNALLKTIRSLSDADLYEQFVHGLLADRAMLGLEWASAMHDKGVVRDSQRLALWLEDVLSAALQIEVVWAYSQHDLTMDSGGMKATEGRVFFFNTHRERDSHEASRFHMSRSLRDLDPYTLALLGEMLRRAPGLVRTHKRQHALIEVLFAPVVGVDTSASPKILVARRRLFQHLLLALLALPVASSATSRVGGMEVIGALRGTIQTLSQYLSRRTSETDAPDWLWGVRCVLSRMHGLREADIADVRSCLRCTPNCALCDYVQILLTAESIEQLLDPSITSSSSSDEALARLVAESCSTAWYENYARAEHSRQMKLKRQQQLRKMRENAGSVYC